MNELNLRKFVNDWCPIIPIQCWNHDFTHMRNVEAFGGLMAERTEGVDNDVVHWFAYLHDIERKKDYDDPDHGKRVPEFIDLIRNTYLIDLTNEQIDKLKTACALHADTHKTGDPTIDVCFDADRLDLPRVGINVDPCKMAPQLGMELAKENYESLFSFIYPRLRDRLVFGYNYIAKNYKMGNLAVRFALNYKGILVSPFNHTFKWDQNAKHVFVNGWYKKSGIYAIPFNMLSDNNFYNFMLKDKNSVVSLLEYEPDDLVHAEDRLITLPKGFCDKMKQKYGAELCDDSYEFFKDNNTIRNVEICVKSCNIIFSAPWEQFWESYKDELISYSQRKCDAYIERKCKLENFGNIDHQDIPELPSVKL